MKCRLTFALCAAIFVAAPAGAQEKAPGNPAPQSAATQKERADAVRYLEVTRQAFLKSVEGVTEAQWKFKPSPETWSIAEVAEHIAISEGLILGMITTQMLQAPPLKPGEGILDEKLIAMITDRSQKAQAPEMLRPVNKWATREALVNDFNAERDKTVAWLKTTTENLRGHAAPHPAFGPLDTHQWILLLAGHSARHTAQIEEAKTAAEYPK